MSMHRHSLAALLWLAVAMGFGPGAAWAKSSDEAPEEAAPKVGEGQPQRTLAERIPSVTHRAFSKRHRVELYPMLGLSLNDPFYRYILPGLGLNYYILESLAVGVSAEYYGGIATAIDDVGGATTLQLPTFNKPNLAARLQVTWAPLYGKISWLAEGVVHFDTYISVSGGVVLPAHDSASASGSVAVGQHYFFNNWMALRLEIRDEFYGMNRDPSRQKGKELQTLLTASVGLCFYLPQEVSEE